MKRVNPSIIKVQVKESDTVLTSPYLKDYHKLFLRYCDDQLPALRRTDKYFKRMIDDYVKTSIITKYTPDHPYQFAILKEPDAVLSSLNFMFYVHANEVMKSNFNNQNGLNYTEITNYTHHRNASKDYIYLFDRKVTQWVRECLQHQNINSGTLVKKQWQAMNTIINGNLHVRNSDGCMKLISTIPSNAYLITKFLEATLSRDMNDVDNVVESLQCGKACGFHYYQMDQIIRDILDEVEENINLKQKMFFSFSMLVSLLENKILTSQPYLNVFVPLAIKNINYVDERLNLNESLLEYKILESQFYHKQYLPSILALKLANKDVNDEPLESSDFQEYEPDQAKLDQTNLDQANLDQTNVRKHAITFLRRFMETEGNSIPKDSLNELLPLVIAAAKSSQTEVQYEALIFLFELVRKGVVIQQAALDELSKGVVIEKDALDDLIPLAIAAVESPQWKVQYAAFMLLSELVRKEMIISKNTLDALIPSASAGLQNVQSKVQEGALWLLYELVKKGLVIEKKYILQGLIISRLQSKEPDVQYAALSLLNILISEGLVFQQATLNQLIPLAIEAIESLEWDVQEKGFLLFYKLISKDIIIQKKDLDELIPLAIAAACKRPKSQAQEKACLSLQKKAFLLLQELVKKGIVIQEAALLNRLISFAIEAVKSPQWKVQDAALLLLCEFVSTGIKIEQEALSQLRSSLESVRLQNTESNKNTQQIQKSVVWLQNTLFKKTF